MILACSDLQRDSSPPPPLRSLFFLFFSGSHFHGLHQAPDSEPRGDFAAGTASASGTNSIQVTRSVRGRLPILAWAASVVHVGLAVFVHQFLVSEFSVHALCPDGSWSLFVDSFDTEGNVNSCVKNVPLVVTASITWSDANSACIALSSGSHLLTSLQVT